MTPTASTILQFAAIVFLSLLAGSTFGIWRGYNPSGYGAITFLEVHQGAVRGLNLLLPVLGLASLAMTVILAIMNRGHPAALVLYLAAVVAIAAGGGITRIVNQPINEFVMTWTADTMPSDWQVARDVWWQWHVWRALITASGLMLLIAAVFVDRDA